MDVDAAFKRRITSGMVVNVTHILPHEFLEDSFSLIAEHINTNIDRFSTIKVNTELYAEFIKHDDTTEIKSFNTKTCAIDATTCLEEWYKDEVSAPILKKMEEFQERDSGWALSRIENICVNINKHTPLCAGCYIETPTYIRDKKAVINIKSYDCACFAWSIVAHLYPSNKNAQRVSNYPSYRTVLNVQNISFPTPLKEIQRFEVDNNLSVNVFTYVENARKRCIAPIRLAHQIRDRHVNLLYIKDGDRAHYMYIKNLSRLVSGELSAHRARKHICNRCLNYFGTAEALLSHETYCANINKTRIVLPDEDNETEKWMMFKNHKNREPVPIVVYADLECLLSTNPGDEGKGTETCEEDREQEDDDDDDDDDDEYEDNANDAMGVEENTCDRVRERKRKKMRIYQTHIPYSVGYYIKNNMQPHESRYEFHRGLDCMEWFAQKMHALVEEVGRFIHNAVPMKRMTDAEERRHSNSISCHICSKPFSNNENRVKDHCHLTGDYRGPAHNKCNLKYQIDYMIPIIFHNLSGYDGHFIIKSIAKTFNGKINVLPINKERYISFSTYDMKYKVGIRFIDSFKFLSTSLDTLSSYLKSDDLIIFKSEFRNLSSNLVESLMRKGVFPYDFVDSYDKLVNFTKLPDKKFFYNRINDIDISDEDYQFACRIWNSFNIQNLGEYSDLYLKTDVLLLADVFENFRKQCMLNYKLDPSHYYTLPGFTWDAMLQFTDIKFELLTDIDMLLMIERGIRGGLCQCSHRYAIANNKYMESYNPDEPSTYLMYYDVNNLYGWAMRQFLPTHGFQWVDCITESEVLNTPDDSEIGYILEVDLKYPTEIHDSHSDLPFCPSHEKSPGSRQKKLIASLRDKQNYVIHYRMLKQCVSQGLIIAGIHRCISFHQSAWLRPYIDLNTRLRTCARNDFEKNLFKLMNNAVFGKTIENVRKRVDVKLVSKWEGRYGARRLIAMPNFHSQAIFNEHFCAIQLKKLCIKMEKPVYIGMSILDISKICLYDFHYTYMKTNFNRQCKLLYTDTDSLIYKIECEDVYRQMGRDLSFFDTSDYPAENVYGMPRVNKKIPGLMKDENCGKIMREFVGLRAKMYAMRTDGCDDVKKSKGIKRYVVERKITFEDYLQCLRRGDQIIKQQNLFVSRKHNVFSACQSKIALDPHDDKRFLLMDSSFGTLPWGHYNINEADRCLSERELVGEAGGSNSM